MESVTIAPKRKEGKPLNLLGIAYQKAEKHQQLEFKASLLKLSERDNQDYWRAFIDVWKYSQTIGRAPSAISAAAHYVLGFNLQSIA